MRKNAAYSHNRVSFFYITATYIFTFSPPATGWNT